MYPISTTANAWTALLQQTEVVARTRQQLSEDISSSIADVLKSVAMKKEEARKKVTQTELPLLRHRLYTDKVMIIPAHRILPKAQVRP